MDELKPVKCGCGGEAKLYSGMMLPATGEYIANVKCESCGIASGCCLSLDQEEAEEKAVENWNLAMGGRKPKVSYGEKDGETVPYCPYCNGILEWE